MSEAAAVLLGAALSFVVAGIGNLLAYRRLQREFRTQFMAERAIVKLLRVKGWKLRSFGVISATIGGFEDDELRKLLVSAGAVRFPDPAGAGVEWWGLLALNREHLARPEAPPAIGGGVAD